MSEHEEGRAFDELAGAWRSIEAPPVGEDLEECDARTRATVQWMRAVWSENEVPLASVRALAARRRNAMREHPLRSVGRRALPFVLAAAAVAAVVIALRVFGGAGAAAPGRSSPASDREHAEFVAKNEPTLPPSAPTASESGVDTETLAAPPRGREGPHVAALGDGTIELRSGPVTLVLVTPADGGGKAR